MVADIEGRPLFVGDDLALLADLASLTAHAIDREEMLIGLGEARREAEESRVARASEARFRALLEADPNPILALDEESRVTWATRQAGELFGCPVERLIGTQLGDLVALHKDETPTQLGDRPVYRSESTGRRIDGTHFPAEIARARSSSTASRSGGGHLGRHLAPRGRPDPRPLPGRPVVEPDSGDLDLRGTQLLLGRGARLDPETRNEPRPGSRRRPSGSSG